MEKLILLAVLIVFAGASSPPATEEDRSLTYNSENVQIVCTIEGMHKELRVFPIYLNGDHVLNVYFKYTGTEPEDWNNPAAKGVPLWWQNMRNDFYRYEIENSTNSAIEIYELRVNTNSYYLDEEGKVHASPPKTYKKAELVAAWGSDFIVIDPGERQARPDIWVHCDETPCSMIQTFHLKIMRTGKKFAFQLVLLGYPQS